jgi:hypothetical protein
VTFGSPRTGNTSWRNTYNAMLGSATDRWVNQDDVITGFPFNDTDWKQTGRRHFMDYQFDPVSTTFYVAVDYDTADQSIGVWDGEKSDHALDEYIEHLEDALRNP